MPEVPEVAGGRAAGVGDEDVVGGWFSVAELGCGLECLVAALGGGDVGGDFDDFDAGFFADSLGCGGERLGGAGDQHEVDALAGEGPRAGAAETFAGGADEG